jgi:sensory rhodopsin
MINTIFLVGMLVFAASSTFFYFSRKDGQGLNTAFLVSFFTLASYVLMWQGSFVTQGVGGEPVYWTRWIFYAISCSLLMLEISKVRGITSAGKITEIIFLNVFVMGTGVLASVSMGLGKWFFFILSSIAYVIQISAVLKAKAKDSEWVNPYIYFGWTGFPVVFLLAPTGFGIFGSAIAMGLYLLLDVYTKVIFNLRLNR